MTTPAMPLHLPLYPEQTPYPLYPYELPEAERDGHGRHAAAPSLLATLRAALRPSRRPAHREGDR